MAVGEGVGLDGFHQLRAKAAATIGFMDPKRIDVHEPPPETASYAANNLQLFIAEKISNLSGRLVAGLGTIKALHSIRDDAEIFRLRMLIQFKGKVFHSEKETGARSREPGKRRFARSPFKLVTHHQSQLCCNSKFPFRDSFL